MRVTEEREKEMRQDLDELHGRHVELKRKFRTLYLAYRQLRYLVRSWREAGGIRRWGGLVFTPCPSGRAVVRRFKDISSPHHPWHNAAPLRFSLLFLVAPDGGQVATFP